MSCCASPGTKVKICGLTNPEDALMAQDMGADMLGFVNAPRSPRYLTPDEIAMIIGEVSPLVPTVMVTHSQDVSEIINCFDASGADILQLHAPLHPEEYTEIRDRVPQVIANVSIDVSLGQISDALIERVCILSQAADYILFDTKSGNDIGGTGKIYNWAIAAELKEYAEKPVIVAGGLNPFNVGDAIKKIKPFAVDVSSGVELALGQKDPRLVEPFIRRAKSP
jgi:phosphoribosylanthranilate isomerase